MISSLVSFVRELYKTNECIPLHAPKFSGSDKQSVVSAIKSSFVSSVGEYVDEFERLIGGYTGSEHAIASVNGSAALYTALYMAGVQRDELVITQSLTFVATCNTIAMLGARPVFIDVDADTLGLSATILDEFLNDHVWRNRDGHCVHRDSGKRIAAVLPMHTFGHPVDIDGLKSVCSRWGLCLVEDAAESLGSLYKNQHTGTFGRFGVLSFNGNKIITTGGGGMLLCQDSEDGLRAKHLTTTAKLNHAYEYDHDELGFNFRLPNLNAALGCAQFKRLESYIESKRRLAQLYENYFIDSDYIFVSEPEGARSNYWLNAVICPDKPSRDQLLSYTNENGVMTRPVWTPMHKLPMFTSDISSELSHTEYLAERLVNLPSSPLVNVCD